MSAYINFPGLLQFRYLRRLQWEQLLLIIDASYKKINLDVLLMDCHSNVIDVVNLIAWFVELIAELLPNLVALKVELYSEQRMLNFIHK